MDEPQILTTFSGKKVNPPIPSNDTQIGPGKQMSLSGIDDVSETPIFRPIHYIGSKLRIADDIRAAVDQADATGGPVCDLFAGSGTVSSTFARFRSVIAVDIQEYSRVLCNALLLPSDVVAEYGASFLEEIAESCESSRFSWAAQPLIEYEAECIARANQGEPESLCELLEKGSIVANQLNRESTDSSELSSLIGQVFSRLRKIESENSPATTALRYFGGVYFSYRQAAMLDEISERISLRKSSEAVDLLLAALLSTASDIVNTVGKQFAQPIRPRDSQGEPKRHLVRQIDRDRAIDVSEKYTGWLNRYLSSERSNRSHQAVRMDYLDMLKSREVDFSVVYADPPYTRDHYSRFYHVLETLCLRDNPVVSKVRANGIESYSRGIYREERHQSPFCIRSKAPKAFAEMFDQIARRGVPLVLSYSPTTTYTGSRPRVMGVDDLIALARTSFSDVEGHPVGSISHSRLNSSENTLGHASDAEILLVCRP